MGESENKEKSLGRNFGCALCLALLLCGLSGGIKAEAQWRVATPYPDNPLKVAVLAGEGRASGSTFPVTLEFSCHPGAAVPRVVLRVPIMVADWDFRAFERASSGIAPSRRRDLTVLASNRRVIERPVYSGIAADNDASFTFGWQPGEALLSRLVRGRDGIQIHLRGMRRSQGQLETRFVLPADDSAMRVALAPCSRSLPPLRRQASAP